MEYEFYQVETQRIVNFFNNEINDELIYSLAERYNLEIRDNFIIDIKYVYIVDELTHHGECYEAGFYDEHAKSITYSREGLKKLGIKLIRHEMGHVIFDQVFQTNHMDKKVHSEKSEEMAVFFENILF